MMFVFRLCREKREEKFVFFLSTCSLCNMYKTGHANSPSSAGEAGRHNLIENKIRKDASIIIIIIIITTIIIPEID